MQQPAPRGPGHHALPTFVDEGTSWKDVPRQPPFMGVGAHARKLYAGKAYNPLAVTPLRDYVVGPTTVGVPGSGQPGGISEEVDPRPYYNPASVLNRRIDTLDAEADASVLVGAMEGAAHGPSGFNYTLADVKPRSSYTHPSRLASLRSRTEPEVWTAPPPGSPCVCVVMPKFSLAAMFMAPSNLMMLRAAMKREGLIILDPSIALLNPDNSCGCAILGGAARGVYTSVAHYGSNFQDTPAFTEADPKGEVRAFAEQYVQDLIAGLRTADTEGARSEYKRVEGNRAAFLPTVEVEQQGGEALSDGLPYSTLPGTGIGIVPTDSLYATYQLTAPMASVKNRQDYTKLTGVHVDGQPTAVDAAYYGPALGPSDLASDFNWERWAAIINQGWGAAPPHTLPK